MTLPDTQSRRRRASLFLADDPLGALANVRSCFAEHDWREAG